MKPTSHYLQITAEEMATEWAKVWKPPDDHSQLHTDNWKAISAAQQQPPLLLQDANHSTPPEHQQHHGGNNSDSSQHSSDDIEDNLPSLQVFHDSLTTCSGGPGEDGWTSQEIRAMARHCPAIESELYQLWRDITIAAPTILDNLTTTPNTTLQDFVDNVWVWRTTGKPKKSDFKTQPINVASQLVRSWHSSIHTLFPLLPQFQAGG